MKCLEFNEHQFKRVGSHRVPCHGSWGTAMPLEPDGTIEYIDYRCRLCGETCSEEKLYSWRANPTAEASPVNQEGE